MITLDTADQLDALGLQIWDPQITPAPAGSALGDTWGPGTGLRAPDAATDAQLYALLAPVIKAIDGRDMKPGLWLTYNQTNASQCRPAHWFINSATEHDTGSGYGWPNSIYLEYHPQPGFVGTASAFAWGGSAGLAACAVFCRAWAIVIRMWLAGNYPLAVTQPPPA